MQEIRTKRHRGFRTSSIDGLRAIWRGVKGRFFLFFRRARSTRVSTFHFFSLSPSLRFRFAEIGLVFPPFRALPSLIFRPLARSSSHAFALAIYEDGCRTRRGKKHKKERRAFDIQTGRRLRLTSSSLFPFPPSISRWSASSPATSSPPSPSRTASSSRHRSKALQLSSSRPPRPLSSNRCAPPSPPRRATSAPPPRGQGAGSPSAPSTRAPVWP